MIRAIGYARVSTEDQAKEGVSLDAQKAKIETYCRLKDMELVEIVEDAGISAKNLRRPGVQKILETAEGKEIDAVVVYKLDRMFRSTVDALETTQRFDRLGIAFHSIEESLNTKNAVGEFFFTLTAALAQMERKLIGERTQEALRHKKQRGERCGHLPFGYALGEDGKLLVEDPEEQAIVKKIRRLRRRGYSLREIAAKLNSEGILNRGGQWNHVSVRSKL